ncbi:MAG: zinc transport system substrate-binding protein, partial [Humisphaera sp.]|nr:zinc transport system substrate-binding protein [Humisphaera sp.]
MRRRPPLLFSALLILSIALGVTGGCGDDHAVQQTTVREPLRVVATTYAMSDIVRAVGGNRVRPEWWVESGDSLTELTENPERRQQLNSVALVVTRGQVDPWTLIGSGNAYQDQRILRLDSLSSAREHDPSHYIWLDPSVARELVDELVTRLGALDPAHVAEFRANAAKFNEELGMLMEHTSATINRAGGGPFVTLDRGLYPLARSFGLDDVKVPLVNLSEPTSFNVRQLRQAGERVGAGAIFASTETPVALLRDWESRLGVPVLPLDPFGSSAQTGRSTYLQMLRYNLAQLEKGVALSKPRERAAPGSLGAVIDSPADLPP